MWLALAVTRRINELKLTQTEAASRLKTKQNKVSKVMNGHLDGISVYRLLQYLTALDCPVKISVARPVESAATVAIEIAA